MDVVAPLQTLPRCPPPPTHLSIAVCLILEGAGFLLLYVPIRTEHSNGASPLQRGPERSGFRVSCSRGFGFQCSGFRVPGFRFRVPSSGFPGSGVPGFRFQESGYQVPGFGTSGF